MFFIDSGAANVLFPGSGFVILARNIGYLNELLLSALYETDDIIVDHTTYHIYTVALINFSNVMETYKIIFSGRLEFGNQKSFEKVYKLFLQRFENYYKSEVLLKGEEIFKEDSRSVDIPRFITQTNSDKALQNTVNLLDYVAQYAVAGEMSVWKTDNGKVLQHSIIEPTTDKVAVQAYLTGRDLVKEVGREVEAREALSIAIEKYERHAKAYERRGFVNYLLKNFEDAIYDYSKSINLYPTNPEPYFGRALVNLSLNKWEESLPDLDHAISSSIPLQPIYWQSRRLKAEALMELKQFEVAEKELKLFNARPFTKDNPNFRYQKRANFIHGQALFALNKREAAKAAFQKALQIPGNHQISDEEIQAALQTVVGSVAAC